MPRGTPNKVKSAEVSAPPINFESPSEPEMAAAPQDGAAVAADKPGLLEAVQMLIERNDRYDFTAGGRPQLSKLTAIVGWDVTTSERDRAWEQLMDRRTLN